MPLAARHAVKSLTSPESWLCGMSGMSEEDTGGRGALASMSSLDVLAVGSVEESKSICVTTG